MLFFPTYFCSNPDTPDKYITFKGWQISINTETVAPAAFTEANAFGSLQPRDPSATYPATVTVQHVRFAIQNSTLLVTFKAKLQCAV